MNEEKVLLADDKPANLQVLVGMLGGRDYNLLIAKKWCKRPDDCPQSTPGFNTLI
jgi:CheY-like chemotaxis protein